MASNRIRGPNALKPQRRNSKWDSLEIEEAIKRMGHRAKPNEFTAGVPGLAQAKWKLKKGPS